jgi:branched-chain amino acid transport system substrate-binding protein
MTQTSIRGTRRRTLKALGAGGALLGAPAIVRSQTPSTIRIGWTISLTGPFAGGASTTQWPNYRLWIKDVNDAGGFNLGGRRVLLEAIEYDDRSLAEEAVRACERLVNQDKVDFMLPPWGTGQNLAVAPIFHRANMPQIAASLVSDRIPEIVKKWNNLFVLLNTSSAYGGAVAEALRGVRTAGRLGDTVAMVHVTDPFGIELSNGARRTLGPAGFKLVFDRGYPLGTTDLAPIIAEAERAKADTFLAFSYPPDTFGLTEAARVRGFNPQVFFVGVGTQFPMYRERFKDEAEGVMGLGGWNPDITPEFRQYIARHVAMHKREPDRWGASLFYAGLQALQQATERVGKLDRSAIINELDKGTFSTIVGPLRFQDNIRVGGFLVGQWQDGEFFGVAPLREAGVRALRFPKPKWRS